MRALPVAGVAIAAIIGLACHRVRVVPNHECRSKPYGTASMKVAAAVTRDSRYGTRALGGLVIRVEEGTRDRQPVDHALTTILVGGSGSDSLQIVRGQITPSTGVVMFDSLAVNRFEVLVRRMGYEAARQRVGVRLGFIDTVTFALRNAGVCLIEQSVQAV